jgi:nitrogen fixation/metabolism regulation signal transduction histidine kinase
MSLRWRLVLLILLATGLPIVTGALVTRQLVREVLEIGLSPQMDAALDAGVRQAREEYQRLRAETEAQADALVAGRMTAVELPAEARIVSSATAGAVADGGPPTVITVTRPLAGGGTLVLERSVPPAWRDDAQLLAGTLQVVRGLGIQRERLVRSYWLIFLALFVLALGVGLVAASRVGRGITGPVARLLAGTDAVAAGRWDTQVPVARGDELGRLTGRFNAMVRTLDLQSRRLVDLETMSGWREMARALAHEVKNPLTPIQLTVEEIRARHPQDPVVEECTRIVVEEVESLRSVVERFREFARPVELKVAPTDLAAMVRDVAALQRDLDVRVEAAAGLPQIAVDADRLRQVLMNLAQNAREATRDRERARLWLELSREDDTVVLAIEDDGPGIPPAERERVFEPYRSGKAGGMGLGLTLVKGIVLAHGGAITVEDGREGGARFVIRLPLEVDRAG